MGLMELMMVGVVALIVVGPKDLPVMFQSLGKMTAKVRRMAREFSSAMNDAANATGASDIAKDLKGIANPKAMGMDALKDAADAFDKWEPGKEPKVADSETAKLRAEQARKIKENMARKGQEKLDAEKASKAEAEGAEAPATTAKAAKPKVAKAKTAKPKAEAKPAAKPAPKPKTTKAKPAATKAKPAAAKAKPAAAKAKPAATKAKPAAAKATPKPKSTPAAKPKADKAS
ncbi:Twin-arginine translocation protein TatB [Candidatus Rhodobacter oscarellae]|uniref:Twin-arginine translocation protein TatB n=1 Tax=Candidatus Rhodobacter oscarellae TaxID=1675527 RepID=A0A0J9E6G2_9RHOB|nr:twin-arginine translocase TatA/TatE family subunit [Candidatus Rhodobacter lobularis]KMW58360.1 Twin-arginine translocation protein TatB [Candidatus Rhodobacter lobularis]